GAAAPPGRPPADEPAPADRRGEPAGRGGHADPRGALPAGPPGRRGPRGGGPELPPRHRDRRRSRGRGHPGLGLRPDPGDLAGRLFEIGKHFRRAGEGVVERRWLALALTGARADLGLYASRDPVDVYDAKGLAEHVLARLGAGATSVDAGIPDHPYFEPGRWA